MLFDYNDPSLVKKEEGLSDFSSVVRTVMKGTKVDRPSDWTVGEINQALDEFTRLKGMVEKGKERALKSPTKKRKPPTLKEYQVEWLRKLNVDEPKRKGLSALEHKWLVRILIQKNMNFGLVSLECNPTHVHSPYTRLLLHCGAGMATYCKCAEGDLTNSHLTVRRKATMVPPLHGDGVHS